MTDTATRPETPAAADPRLGEALKVALDGPYHASRQRARDTLTKDEILRDPALSMDEARAWTLKALTHLSTRYAVRVLKEEARAVFPNTHAPRDLDLIEIPFRERGEPRMVRGGARAEEAAP